MIDPIIFSREIFGITLTLRWYGVIVMIGVIAGSLIVERELKRRGESGDRIWDALIWVLPIGIIGARLWFVMNATLGGDSRYANDPMEIVRIWNGGLHIFGGFLFGSATLLVYLRQNKLDPWLFLDVAGPGVLIGQGIGRIANFINQELYGPPTTLPWGIQIEAQHRLAQYQDLSLFPVETTRFHPTFAYEMLWNFSAAWLLLWLSRRYEKELKPGTLFSGWLLAAGLGRVLIEFFRPDQPKIPGLGISYSSIVAALMAIAGAVILTARYKATNLSFAQGWEEEYQVSQAVTVAALQEEPPVEEKKVSRAKRVPTPRTEPVTAKKTKPKTPARKMTKPGTKTSPTAAKKMPATRTKKSS